MASCLTLRKCEVLARPSQRTTKFRITFGYSKVHIHRVNRTNRDVVMTVIVNINYHSLNVVFAIKIVIIVYLGEGEGNVAQGWFVLFASSTRLYMQAGARRGTHYWLSM